MSPWVVAEVVEGGSGAVKTHRPLRDSPGVPSSRPSSGQAIGDWSVHKRTQGTVEPKWSRSQNGHPFFPSQRGECCAFFVFVFMAPCGHIEGPINAESRLPWATRGVSAPPRRLDPCHKLGPERIDEAGRLTALPNQSSLERPVTGWVRPPAGLAGGHPGRQGIK